MDEAQHHQNPEYLDIHRQVRSFLVVSQTNC
jgi:hypothetical protein